MVARRPFVVLHHSLSIDVRALARVCATFPSPPVLVKTAIRLDGDAVAAVGYLLHLFADHIRKCLQRLLRQPNLTCASSSRYPFRILVTPPTPAALWTEQIKIIRATSKRVSFTSELTVYCSFSSTQFTCGVPCLLVVFSYDTESVVRLFEDKPPSQFPGSAIQVVSTNSLSNVVKSCCCCCRSSVRLLNTYWLYASIISFGQYDSKQLNRILLS